MATRITVVTPTAPCLFWESLPRAWRKNVVVVHPTQFVNDRRESGDDVYTVSDSGYEVVSRAVNNPTHGFCKSLAELCINKYTTRQSLKTMQDIPHRLVGEDGVVEWEGDAAQKLIAKPVHGSGSRDVHVVRHGHRLPPLANDRYIVEQYVADDVPRVSVDGYVCGADIGILGVWDSVYHRDAPTQFHYLAFPSRHAGDARIADKFAAVARELQQTTGCDNQIIDMELFVERDRVTVMEINPRLGVNYIPIFEQATGYCPWQSLQRLKRGQKPVRTRPTSSGVCRYNRGREAGGTPRGRVAHDPIEDVDVCFSIDTATHAHTYATSAVKGIRELVRITDDIAQRAGGRA